MRVVFLGNVAGYTPGVLEPLAQRSADPDDPVSLAAIVCPSERTGHRRSLAFSSKRALGHALDRIADREVPQRVKSAASAGSGVHRELQRLAHRARAPMWWPRSLNDEELCERVRCLDADLTIVAGLDRIVREPALSAFPTLYNLHPSMLPEYRGAVPEFWQLDAGLAEGGVTIHRIDPGIDTGPIVLQETFDIEPWFDADGLLGRSVEVGTELIGRLLAHDPGRPPEGSSQVDGSYQPIPGPGYHRVPIDRCANGVFDRARAVGFDHPLLIDLEAEAWRTGAGLRTVEPSAATVRLELYEPVPYPDATGGEPGDVVKTHRGGVALSCATGVVEFRRIAEKSTAGA